MNPTRLLANIHNVHKCPSIPAKVTRLLLDQSLIAAHCSSVQVLVLNAVFFRPNKTTTAQYAANKAVSLPSFDYVRLSLILSRM